MAWISTPAGSGETGIASRAATTTVNSRFDSASFSWNEQGAHFSTRIKRKQLKNKFRDRGKLGNQSASHALNI